MLKRPLFGASLSNNRHGFRFFHLCASLLTATFLTLCQSSQGQTVSSTDHPTYIENGSEVPIAPNLVITDPSGQIYSHANVAISSGYRQGDDDLLFSGYGGITGSFNQNTGVMTLSGNGTAADYQAALRLVKFYNPSNAPGISRQFEITLADAIYNRYNGHYYQLVEGGQINWDAARDAAAAQTMLGMTGYLVTVTSPEENNFISSRLNVNTWMGASDTHTEGVWRWVTGPEGLEDGGLGRHFSNQFKTGNCSADQAPGINGFFSGWGGGEPNDCSSGEDVAHFIGGSGEWNDYPNNGGVDAYVIEFGGMPGDVPVGSITATVEMDIVNTDDAFTINNNDLYADESPANGFVIGTPDFNDPDAGTPFSASFEIVGGTAASFCTIDSAGNIRVTNGASLDYETAPTFDLQVRMFDSSTSLFATVTIRLNNMFDAFPVMSSNDTTVFSGAPIAIAPSFTMQDLDNFVSKVQIKIGAGFDTINDVLSFTPVGSITGNYDNSTGILTLTGDGWYDYNSYYGGDIYYEYLYPYSATSSNEWETVIRSVTFSTTGSGSRNFSITGGNNSYSFSNDHIFRMVAYLNELPNWNWIPLTPENSKTYAAQIPFLGMNGYLPTITSAEEQQTVNTVNDWWGSFYLGANDSLVEGEWRWTAGPEGLQNAGTGVPFTQQDLAGACMGNTPTPINGAYQNWAGMFPNDCGNADFMWCNWNKEWEDNDGTSNADYLIIEYGGLGEVFTNKAYAYLTTASSSPVLTGTNYQLPDITEDITAGDNTGMSVGDILGTNYTDPNGDIVGIVVTGMSSNGQWQRSTDGGNTWFGFDYTAGGNTISPSAAMPFTPGVLIRFMPNADFTGTASFTFRAWDQTMGSNGNPIDVTTNGANTAFSSQEATASIEVTPVNDAPDVVISATNALNFGGGSEHVVISDPEIGGDMTVEAWINVDDPHKNWSRIIDFGNGPASDNIELGFHGTSGLMFAEVFNGSFSSGNSLTITNTVIPTNQWVHVACVWDGMGTSTIYWDGVPVASGATFDPTTTSRSNCYIGKSNWADEYFDGRMKDIRIWDIARSQSEIQADMHRDLTGSESGLKALYKGTEGGNDVPNSVSGQPAGNLQGATYMVVNGPISTIQGYEDSSFVINQFQLNDIDAASGNITATLSVSNGTLTATGGAAVTNNGTASIILDGSLSDINTLISNGGLTYLSNLNYTGSDQLSIAINDNGNSGAGGSLTDNDVLNLNINATNDAPVLTDTTFGVVENTSNGTVIANLLATDSENDIITYAIVSQSVPGAFTINSTTGAISVNNAYMLNYEAYTSMSLTVSVTDGAKSSTGLVTINISNVNEAPIVADDQFSVEENLPTGEFIGALSGSDIDGDALTYSIVSQSVPNAIAVAAGTNELVIDDATAFNFETNPTIDLVVRVSDGVLTQDANITVQVTNINEGPSIASSTLSVDENSANGQFIANAGGTDIDGDALTYTIVGASRPDVFTIDNTTGDISVYDESFMDHENYQSFTITVEVSDGSLTEQAVFTININDINEMPSLSDALFSINENSTNGATVGTLTATDVDANSVITYSIVSQSVAGAFAIDQNTGEVTVADASVLDFESNASITFTVRVSDGTYTADALVTVSLVDVNELPTITGTTIVTDEDVAILVGNQLSPSMFSDPDGNLPTGVKIVSLPINGQLTIAGAPVATGDVLTLSQMGGLTYTPAANYYGTDAFLINATDGQVFAAQDATIDVVINSIDDLPVVTSTTLNIDEEQTASLDFIPTLFSDEDGDVLTHIVITTLPQHGNVSVSGLPVTLGQSVTVADIANLAYTPAIDFNGNDELGFTAYANGAAGSETFTYFIVAPVNDGPTNVALSNLNITENNNIGDVIGTFSATDVDGQSPVLFYLVSGLGDADNGSFMIQNGQLVAAQTFNYETRSFYSIRVAALDDNNAAQEMQITISVLNANDTPADIYLTRQTVEETYPVGSFVASLATLDEDANDTFTYSLVSGNGDADNSSFTIAGNQLLTNEVFDFETRNAYSIRISTTDNTGATFEKAVVITITDMNDAPTALNITDNTILENQPIGTVVADLFVNDEDANDVNTFTLVSGQGATDNNAFDIDGDHLVTNAVFDFETKSSYTVRVRATDLGGAFTEQAFVIQVINVNEGPGVITLNNNTIGENLNLGQLIGKFATTDADSNETFTYTLVQGAGAIDNSLFTLVNDDLKANATYNFEANNSYSIRVRSTDAGGNFSEDIFTITVTDNNDAPTGLDFTVTNTNENLPAGTSIGLFSTIDEDAVDSHTYTLVQGTGDADNSLFSIVNNKLQSNISFNYEDRNLFSVRVATSDAAGASFEKAITIQVTNVNESPDQIFHLGETIAENQTVGTAITMFNTQDEDFGDSHTYSLVSGTGDADNASFSVVNNELVSNEVFNFEVKNQYTVRLRSTDAGGEYTEKVINISVLNANDLPTVNVKNYYLYRAQSYSFMSREVVIGYSDEDANPAFGFKIASLPAEGALKLQGGQGVNVGDVLSLSDLNKLQYQSNTTFVGTDAFTWYAFDGQDFATQPTTVNMNILAGRQQPSPSLTGTRVAIPSGVQIGFITRTATKEIEMEQAQDQANELPMELVSTSYPNPFSNMVAISYELPVDATVEVRIFDMTGKEVKVLVSEMQSAGKYTATWNGEDTTNTVLTAGQYIYMIKTTDANGTVNTTTGKMVKVE
ncbi:MAG: cadherin domain-containing protein [Chitinophagales bacterium]|nr:cadherin domain-containing protein [Chitinophagales bacterium]